MPNNIDSIVKQKQTDVKSVDVLIFEKPPKPPTLKKKSRWQRWYGKNKTRLKILIGFIVVIALCISFFAAPLGIAFDLFRLTKAGKYLILFQNNAELRGGGGFLGSFAVVDLDGRKVKRYYFEANIYKKDNEYTKTNKDPMPKFFTDEFGPNVSMALRDANYHPDFSLAASNVANYYFKEYQEQVDGVVAIDASLVVNLLKMTGPIFIPGHNETVASGTFFNLLQQRIQDEYFKNTTNQVINEPKSILKDLVDPLLSKVAKQPPKELYNFFLAQTKEKHILFWFKDERQKIVEANQWGGRIIPFNGESIFVSNNNVGGEKSSLSIDQSIVVYGPSQTSRQRSVVINRRHHGGNFYQSGTHNKNYMHVYLPVNSRIISVIRNDITLSLNEYFVKEELGRTVVGLWATTPLNQTSTIAIQYELSSNIGPGFLYQKQPGTISDSFKLIYGQRVYFEGDLRQDKVI